MTNAKLRGILPALVTPLREDRSLDRPAFEKLLEHVYSAGCHGVYLCGSTGEGIMLPPSLRREIVEIAAANSPKHKLITVHAGATALADAVELVRHAESIGAHAVSSIRPYGSSFAEMMETYRHLTQATSLPFIAYYFPAEVGGPLGVSQLEQVCALPGVVGLKFTDYDLYTLSLIVRQGHLVFHGRDEMLAAGFLMGACGGIGSIYNVAPHWFIELYDHCQAGRWTEARQIQDRINDLIRILVAYPFLSALKRAITWVGIPCGRPLAPRLALTDAQDRALVEALEALPGLRRA